MRIGTKTASRLDGPNDGQDPHEFPETIGAGRGQGASRYHRSQPRHTRSATIEAGRSTCSPPDHTGPAASRALLPAVGAGCGTRVPRDHQGRPRLTRSPPSSRPAAQHAVPAIIGVPSHLRRTAQGHFVPASPPSRVPLPGHRGPALPGAKAGSRAAGPQSGLPLRQPSPRTR